MRYGECSDFRFWNKRVTSKNVHSPSYPPASTIILPSPHPPTPLSLCHGPHYSSVASAPAIARLLCLFTTQYNPPQEPLPWSSQNALPNLSRQLIPCPSNHSSNIFSGRPTQTLDLTLKPDLHGNCLPLCPDQPFLNATDHLLTYYFLTCYSHCLFPPTRIQFHKGRDLCQDFYCCFSSMNTMPGASQGGLMVILKGIQALNG